MHMCMHIHVEAGEQSRTLPSRTLTASFVTGSFIYLMGGGGCLCYKVIIEAIGQLSQECFLFYHVSSGDQIQVVRLCRKYTDSSSLPAFQKTKKL